MTDSPQLLGRNRVRPQALSLGGAVPLTRRPFDDTAEPVEPLAPKTADELRAESEERPTLEEVTASTPPAHADEESSRPEEPGAGTPGREREQFVAASAEGASTSSARSGTEDLRPPVKVEEPEATLAIPGLRDPIRTAAIPYDADILNDEADFLIRRAAALRQMASAIRVLAEPRERAA